MHHWKKTYYLSLTHRGLPQIFFFVLVLIGFSGLSSLFQKQQQQQWHHHFVRLRNYDDHQVKIATYAVQKERRNI